MRQAKRSPSGRPWRLVGRLTAGGCRVLVASGVVFVGHSVERSGMRYTRLGSSGLKVSRIGLGMMSYGDPRAERWVLSEDGAEPIVRRAVEAGVTLFDTADMYSDGASEQITGRLLGKLFNQRSDYVLATK